PSAELADRFLELTLRRNAHLDILTDFPDVMHVRHDLIVGAIDVNRHAYHCPRRETCEPEGFYAISVWIAQVETDIARVCDEPVYIVPLLEGSEFEVSNVVKRLDPERYLLDQVRIIRLWTALHDGNLVINTFRVSTIECSALTALREGHTHEVSPEVLHDLYIFDEISEVPKTHDCHVTTPLLIEDHRCDGKDSLPLGMSSQPHISPFAALPGLCTTAE